MSGLWFLWEVFINITECYFFYYMLRNKLGYKISNKKYVYIGLVVLFLIVTVSNYFRLNFQILMLLIFIFELIYSVAFFRGSIAMCVIWGSCGIIVFLTANLLTSVILKSILGVEIIDTLYPSVSRISATLFYTSICVIIFMLLANTPNTRIVLPISLQLLLISIVIIGIILAIQIVSFALDPNFTGTYHNLLVVFSFSLLFMLFVIIFLVHKIGSVIQKKAEADNKLESMRLEQQNQDHIQGVMRLWNHDQHHHINALQSYAYKNDLVGVKQYLREMDSELEASTTLINTSNAVIDGILNSKLSICRLEKIPLRVIVKDLKEFPLGKMETSSLLGNLLDNAIDACKNYNKGAPVYIEFKMFRKRGMYNITVTNTSNDEYKYTEGELTTSKTEGHHGYGLPRIKQIVEDAGGFCSFTELSNRFRVEIYLVDTRYMEMKK